MIFDSILTLVLVALNGFFVAAEFAIVKVRPTQIELRAKAGSSIAALTYDILLHLDAYLSATQLGITLASLGLGWIGESVVARMVLSIMALLGYQPDPALAHTIALPVAFALITFLHIVFGELAPKSLAIQRSEAVALWVAVPLRVFYLIFKPFIWALNGVATITLRSFGITMSGEEEIHSAEELQYLLDKSKEGGEIESAEHELIKNVFEFGERTVKQIMVARPNIFALDIAAPIDHVLDAVIEQGYSRVPVFRETLDNVIGVVYAKDILVMMRYAQLVVLQDILHPVYTVQEDINIHDLLRELQKRRAQMAIVVDEFGGTAGIVTMEDIIEEIVGDIRDEYDEEAPQNVQENDKDFTVQARVNIVELNEMLPTPLPTGETYETLGGFMNELFGRIPEAGQSIRHNGYQFTIEQSTKRAIESVRIEVLGEYE